MKPDTFKRVKPSHDLDIYRGVDMLGRDALLLITSSSPVAAKSSKSIEVISGRRKDKKFSLMFSLRDARYVDIFDCFCKDIIGASEAQSVADKDANIFFVNRYNKWAALFEKAPNDILSAEVVKGLIGEILVLKNILIPRLGEVPSMQAWMGPLSAPQDFIFENSWVEVKTISSSRDSVRISSVEQLDSPNCGQMAIVRLDPSNIAERDSLGINDLAEEMVSSLRGPEARNLFEEKLLAVGYCFNKRYDDIRFSFKKIDLYSVSPDFPSIKRESIPPAILRVEYDISIPTIENFKIEEP